MGICFFIALLETKAVVQPCVECGRNYMTYVAEQSAIFLLDTLFSIRIPKQSALDVMRMAMDYS